MVVLRRGFLSLDVGFAVGVGVGAPAAVLVVPLVAGVGESLPRKPMLKLF